MPMAARFTPQSSHDVLSGLATSAGAHGKHIPNVDTLLPMHGSQPVLSLLGPVPAGHELQVMPSKPTVVLGQARQESENSS